MGFYQRRLRRPALSVACGLLALGGLTAAVPVCWADSNEKTVSIDVAGADFHAVVLQLEQQANIEVVVRDGEKPYGPVSLHLKDSTLSRALRTIAFSAGAKFSKNADGIYVFEPNDSYSVPPVQMASLSGDTTVATQQMAGSASDASSRRYFPPGSLQWHPIVLQHAVPNDILKLMKWDKDLVELDPFKPVRLPDSHPVITSSQPNLAQPPVNPYANPYANPYNNPYANPYNNPDYPSVPIGTGNAAPPGANYSAGRSVQPGSPNQAGQFPGAFPGGGGFQGGFPGGGGFQGGFPGGGVNPFQTNGNNPFQQPGVPPGVGNTQLQQQALPDGVDQIFALQSNNSLLVHATPEGFREVNALVKILDVAPRQVQIKVEFVTASVTDVDNLGINFDLVPFPGVELATSQGNSTIVNGVQPTFLQYATGNIVAQLFQTLTRSRGKVVQAPIITTTNNVTANISVATQIPFFTTTVVNTGGVNNGTAQGTQVNFLPLQTGLVITPRINSDDSVTMNLTPQITDTTGQSVGGVPATITQSINTLRTVRSGDTMVLGGLVRKQETSSSQRIPLLSDLPILGGLFRTRSKQVNDQELLIFVTPTIIGESNDSGAANANGGQSVTVTP